MMRTRLKWSAACASLGLMVGLTGCGGPPPGGQAPAADSGKVPAAASKPSEVTAAPATSAAAAPTSGSAAKPTGKPIVIGVAGPFTGPSADFGTQIKLGVQVAVDEVNSGGGIAGRPVEIRMEDDAGKAADAANVANTLAGDAEVLGVVGHFNSSCSNNAKPVYSQQKVVMISPASTAVDVTKDSDYAFRNIFTDEFQGRSLAVYVGKILGLKKVAILFDNDDYGTGLKESFKNTAKKLNMEILSETAYNKESPDFRSQLTTIQSANPDVLLVAGLYSEAATIARQARELGLKVPLAVGDGVFADEFINLAGPASEGTVATCPFLFELAGDRGKAFAERFKKLHRGATPNAWAAQSYDAFMLIVEGLKAKGTTRQGVFEFVKGINSADKAFDGLTGKTFFDAEGDCRKPVQVATVKNGKWVAAEKQLTPADTELPGDK